MPWWAVLSLLSSVENNMLSEFTLAGILIALLSLIWSKFPFIQLVYLLSVLNATNWDEMGIMTVTMLIATVGANVYKNFEKE